MRFLKSTAFCLLSLAALTASYAQGPERFRNEVTALTAKDADVNDEHLILFTGSSSIRIWKDLKQRFPEYNIINRGFGGSSMADLLYYEDELIFSHRPEKIFIYEGDNDIAGGKTTAGILASADSLLRHIRRQLPQDVKVYFISPKPSIARQELQEKYETFNENLKRWAKKQKNVRFIDVWSPMLAADGKVMTDIFLDDNLHMNAKGYDIWEKVIRPYLQE